MTTTFNPKDIRKHFPILNKKIHGHPLIYFDNAATMLKPQKVVDRIRDAYLLESANIHRAVHFLSEKATEAFESVRTNIAHFIGAAHSREIIFTKGSTNGINLVAQSYGRKFLSKNDIILISHMEHHSNIIPWQILCEEKGCQLKVIPVNEFGEIDLDSFEKCLSEKVKLLCLIHTSNTLGTINPIKIMIQQARKFNILSLIDGAQSIGHQKIDVQDYDCDFFVFSGHKILGPTGTGVLYGKEKYLEVMPPVEGGGEMILNVSFEKTTYNQLPYKFEAGTPHIVGVIGMGSAIDFFKTLDLQAIQKYEQKLLSHLTHVLEKIEGLFLLGKAKHKIPICSFDLKNVHPHDIGSLMNEKGIAIRTGHHCTQPLMKRFDLIATARASLSFYNTTQEIDQFSEVLLSIQKFFFRS